MKDRAESLRLIEGMDRRWQEKLKRIPDSPGVYLMKDAAGEVIYVGKAASLRARIRSYFQRYHQLNEAKVRAIRENLADLEYIATAREVEALTLEEDLIKSYRPRFNVRLKDDKRFPYLAITVQEPFPKLLFARRAELEGARYFGPYTNAQLVRENLNGLRSLFPLRGCNDRIVPGRPSRRRPCLDYSIKQCSAPCVGQISQEEYRRIAEGLCRFLGGRGKDLLRELREEMAAAAAALEFERAARLRDRITAFERMIGQRQIRFQPGAERDVIGLACADDLFAVQLFSVRDGRVRRREKFLLEAPQGSTSEEILAAFLKRFYSEASEVPREILLPQPIEDEELIARWLSELRGGRIKLLVPQRGPRLKLVKLAGRNAELALMEEQLKASGWEQERAALEELQRYLSLTGPPRRIEGYDASTIHGAETVGALVVFEDGRPKKSDYRRFKIKSTAPRDDYAMLAEVLGRRIGDERFPEVPDLVLIDGGKGQLSAARKVMDSRGWGDVPAIGLAKEHEEVFVKGRSAPLPIPKDSKALYLLQRVRDEAHRFALSYHQLRRKRET
ncbi:MAG: excinuclease ABC subunit UvrC, partial [Candidatus Bipolaricaulia bacterium]